VRLPRPPAAAKACAPLAAHPGAAGQRLLHGVCAAGRSAALTGVKFRVFPPKPPARRSASHPDRRFRSYALRSLGSARVSRVLTCPASYALFAAASVRAVSSFEYTTGIPFASAYLSAHSRAAACPVASW